MRGRHIVVVGLMGSGKTSIGKRVAKRLDLPYVDSDDALKERTGHTARELLASEGVAAMHEAERAVTSDAMASGEPTVIGAPASIVLTPAMRDELRRQYTVWLCADPHWLAEKVRDKANRPFVDDDPDVVVRQHEERKALYEQVASLVVDVTRRDKDEVASEIVAAVSRSAG